MNLLTTLNSLLNFWRPAFCKEQAFARAKEHAFACLCGFGRKTITSLAIYLGRDQTDITADYKLYGNSKWDTSAIFDPLMNEAVKLIDDDYIPIAADDTILRKTGKKIPSTSWRRDPMSPAFHVNFVWGLRFLQFSITMPLYQNGQTPCRAIPIRFIDAPSIKKPGKKASKEEWDEYKKVIKTHNLSTTYIDNVKQVRRSLDLLGFANKTIMMTTDASFCNKNCLQADIPRVHSISRCRRNIKLCFPAPLGGRRVYDKRKFTPEEIRMDESIAWKTARTFYGGEWREIRYKEVKNVLWQNGARRKPLRTIVIAPIPYVRGGKRNYRDPAFLLCTDLDCSIEKIIQYYLDHFQIEYNHKDEKSILGVGEAQVRNERSVYKQPALHVASYSALLLANIMVYQDQHHIDFGQEPFWRRIPKRNTTRALIGLLRKNLLERPEKIIEIGLTPPIIAVILSKVA